MDKRVNLFDIPAELASALSAAGISTDGLLTWANADMDPDGSFRRHVLLLTRSSFIHGRAPGRTQRRIMTGAGHPDKDDYSTYEWESWGMDRLSDPGIDNLVVGGLFHVAVDGVDQPVAAYTNSYGRRVNKLRDFFGDLCEGKEIPEERLTEEFREHVCPKCGTPYPDKDRKICPKCMDKRSLFFRLASYFKPHIPGLVAISLFSILNALANSVWPYLNGTILYDRVLSRDTGAYGWLVGETPDFFVLLLILALMMAGLKLMQQLFGILKGRVVARIVPEVVARIKSQVFSSIQSLSVSFFSKRQTGSLMTRIVDDAGSVSELFIDGLPFILPNVMTVIFSAYVMFSTDWRLALVATVVLPPVFIASGKLEPILWHYYSRQHQTNRNMKARINDNLTGARVVKAFGQQDQEMNRFAKVNDRVKNAQMDAVKFDTKFSAMFYTAKDVTVLLVWSIGALLVLKADGARMTYGTLLSFVGYVELLQGPLDFFSYIFRWWSNSMNSAQRIFEIIDSKPDVVERKDPVRVYTLQGDVRLDHVSFSYDQNKKVLKDVSLHVKPGMMLGIVGKSGAGKSTLVNLITRLYDPTEGHIYLDGIDVRDMSFEDVRRNVAIVSQETYIFRGTIFENIAYGNPDATPQQVLDAAIAASAHDFICKLPDGYDTLVGSGGRSLSGGERQRVSIARAILADPRILILDEATAAVDTETERNIQASLSRLIVGRTTLSIAHRLSTLRDADELIVLEDGAITEQGDHMTLVRQKGAYFKLLQIQSKALAMRGLGGDPQSEDEGGHDDEH